PPRATSAPPRRWRRAKGLAAAGAGRAGRLLRHERAGEGRRLLRTRVERRLEPRERPVAARQADPVDLAVAHATSVKLVLHVAARAHAGRRLLRAPEQRAEGR